MTATTTATATAGDRALTGKRRIAFASFVDEARLPGFLGLLRSLALHNPALCEDFAVLHEELSPTSWEAVHRLHPRVVPFRVEPGRPPAYALLDALRLRGYDTVVAVDSGMEALGDIGHLLTPREGWAGLPSGDDECGDLLVIQREFLTDAFCRRIDAALRNAEHEGGRHAQDVLETLAQDSLTPLTPRFNLVRQQDGQQDRPACSDTDFRTAYLDLKGARHPDLVIHYATAHRQENGALSTAQATALCNALYASSRYEEAVAAITAAQPLAADDHAAQLAAGRALIACSRYPEAERHLLIAAAHHPDPVRPYRELARCAWIRDDRAQAHAYAAQALAALPADRGAHELFVRTGPEAPAPQEHNPARQLSHVAYYMDQQGNAGDKVLPEAVRLCFGPDTGPSAWHAVHVHQEFDGRRIDEVNRRRGVVVGGGGLFLPDTSPNGHSSWQWNVPDAALSRIDVPLAVFAVGFNSFDGQGYPRPGFPASLRGLVERADFFGLRNHGSVERVRDLLPAHLHDRVVHQPCPTTVLDHLRPPAAPVPRVDTVLVNCAYDRSGMRFGHDYEAFLAHMARAVTALGRRAEVRYAAHSGNDERFVLDLRSRYGISLPVLPMYDYTNTQTWAAYRSTRLVIGMRGHASMIPFGVGTPVLSLVSHPKMMFFLQDIGRPEWGVSVHDRNLSDVLVDKATHILDDHARAVADVRDRQNALWQVTRGNLEVLEKTFGSNGQGSPRS